jgi:hypothetical protein
VLTETHCRSRFVCRCASLLHRSLCRGRRGETVARESADSSGKRRANGTNTGES